MSILTLGISLKQDASTSRRPFFERLRTTHPARSSISHPQLRDLLICPNQAHHVQTVSGNGVDAHVFGQYTMRLMEVPTTFAPNCLVHGFGMVAMGGENTDLLIRSTDIASRWELKLQSGNSIVNSACFHQPDPSSNVQLLVCNNDQTITQYELSTASLPHPSSSSTSEEQQQQQTASTIRSSISTDSQDQDQKPTINQIGTIHLPVPVNHCSISPDKKTLVAVGDSNEVFLFDNRSSRFQKRPTLSLNNVSSSIGSFSTSWSSNSFQFAVASEAERIFVFDTRKIPYPLLTKHSIQKGRSGATRVVKFTPKGPNELLAFTEHRSLVHVLDARTFDSDHEQVLTVPTPLPGLSPFPPRLPPGSIRPNPIPRNSREIIELEETETNTSNEEIRNNNRMINNNRLINRQLWGTLTDEEEPCIDPPNIIPTIITNQRSIRIHGNNNSIRLVNSQDNTIPNIRSGMWDDLIGLDWSPCGDYLVSGTEAGLVEWKIRKCSRTGFGDTRLC
ncbi:hypothetical protein CROQUDRAFT_717720 [Cronartium quercuum f. sp. fusiforme G11]|uniref:DUF2415 domain-containing protein n=1 Tax=Cronartium quercuum f. sp. fusiforme G11 TaxID=708437 RepID=A0A9P6N996_9BASI|nr:hypothetical protein CROQUDRAFT_717720 [Cronartium quercuum f. sp. fusiforme G11]